MHKDQNRQRHQRIILCSLFVAILASGIILFGSFAQDAPQRVTPVDFRRDIQPILAENCVKCHAGATAPAELRLDSPESLLHGGTSGPAVVPGNAARSLMMVRIQDTGNNRMPPGGQLKPEEIALMAAWVNDGAKADASVDFVTQIQPLLRSSCYSCHSGNEPKGQFHLDDKGLALKGGAIGSDIVPGNSTASLLPHRLRGEGGRPRMPMVGNALTDDQIALIEKWIDQGANRPDSNNQKIHWSYLKPVRSQVPAVKNPAWIKNPIDSFILARLEKEGLHFSAEAPKEKLVRRVYLDIVGMPPTPKQVDEFINDKRPDAYERLVDQLLASPHYGERMTTPWLDLARYGDSNGYERDFQRVAWPYRDWVINSFNENKPFDQFTIEQLAGDMLPAATKDQKIATGFVRSSMLNTEGGTDPEEQNWVAQLDRAITVGNVFLGSTIQCTQCHNHKYDPFTQKQFYQMVAFFNNAKFEAPARGGYGGGDDAPSFTESRLDLPTPEQAKKRDELNAQIADLTKQLNADTPEYREAEAVWEKSLIDAEKDWKALHASRVVSEGGATLTLSADGSVLASGKNPDSDTYILEAKTPIAGKITALRIEALPHPSLSQSGPGRDYYGNFYINDIRIEVGPSAQAFKTVPMAEIAADNVRTKVIGRNDRGERIWRSDVSKESIHIPVTAVLVPEKPIEIGPDGQLRVTISQASPYLGVSLGNFRVSVTTSDNPRKILEVTNQLRALLPVPRDQRPAFMTKLLDVTSLTGRRGAPVNDDRLIAQWRTVAQELAPVRNQIAQLRQQITDLKIPSTLILSENPAVTHPKSFVHERGAYTAKAEEVDAGVPSFLGSLPQDVPPNRLGLAKWLVNGENPLTARVRVNQIWQTIFGRGIVETAEDFGTQGFPPSHPELLDWLATEFVASGWDQKALVRSLVTSNTYRQSSEVTPDLLDKDPKNALLARGPRFRVEAEMVRDIGLTASGLLSEKIGGPPVMPPQPDGMWNIPFQTADDKWIESQGEDRYRRAMYIFIRRTVRYPSMTVFDAPSREVTLGRRDRSNTPLQALTTLNDPAFFEMAQAMAKRIQTEGGSDTASRVTYGFRLATARRPNAKEEAALISAFEKERQHFAADPKEAESIAGKADPDLAAWTMVSNGLLNLDETITKE